MILSGKKFIKLYKIFRYLICIVDSRNLDSLWGLQEMGYIYLSNDWGSRRNESSDRTKQEEVGSAGAWNQFLTPNHRRLRTLYILAWSEA